jgi:hypothetical protein
MTATVGTQAARIDEEPIERAVRELLVPLELELDRNNNIACTILLVLAIPVSVWVLYALGLGWGVAFGIGATVPFVLFCLCVPLYESFPARRARDAFDRRFPEGSPDRPVALRVLCEMQRPSKAEQRLQRALGLDCTADADAHP